MGVAAVSQLPGSGGLLVPTVWQQVPALYPITAMVLLKWAPGTLQLFEPRFFSHGTVFWRLSLRLPVLSGGNPWTEEPGLHSRC